MTVSEFKGTGRFEVIRRLGEWGMGQVHEVLDRETGGRLAAKSLTHIGSLELYLFKNEFRALSDIVHPNLVGLHELFASGDMWTFTMDLVEGRPFLHHVWGEGATLIPTDVTAISGHDPGGSPTNRPTQISGTSETAHSPSRRWLTRASEMELPTLRRRMTSASRWRWAPFWRMSRRRLRAKWPPGQKMRPSSPPSWTTKWRRA